MTRLLPLLIFLAVPSCSSMLISARETPGENYASLSVVAAQAPVDPMWGYGILLVDDQEIGKNNLHVYVARGSRSIYYTCPNFDVIDGMLKIEHKFVAGKSYVLTCNSSARGTIQLVTKAGG